MARKFSSVGLRQRGENIRSIRMTITREAVCRGDWVVGVLTAFIVNRAF